MRFLSVWPRTTSLSADGDFDDVNSNKMNFSCKLLVKSIFHYGRERETHKKRKSERNFKIEKETRTVQNAKREQERDERGTANVWKRDRDELPLWHCVIRILCRLKCFMQVEISIKCCSNFLFKLTSWLNCQIIHRLHFDCDANANQVPNLNLCGTFELRRHIVQLYKVLGGCQHLNKTKGQSVRPTTGLSIDMNPNLNANGYVCFTDQYPKRKTKMCPGCFHTEEKNKSTVQHLSTACQHVSMQTFANWH